MRCGKLHFGLWSCIQARKPDTKFNHYVTDEDSREAITLLPGSERNIQELEKGCYFRSQFERLLVCLKDDESYPPRPKIIPLDQL